MLKQDGAEQISNAQNSAPIQEVASDALNSTSHAIGENITRHVSTNRLSLLALIFQATPQRNLHGVICIKQLEADRPR